MHSELYIFNHGMLVMIIVMPQKYVNKLSMDSIDVSACLCNCMLV